LLVILTQAQIIEKIGSSAAETFAGLYEQYLPKVYRYVNYRIPDVHTAEDLTSTVFEKALTKFNSYKADKAAFSTWIFTIARNTITDHFRDSQSRRTVLMEDMAMAAEADDRPEEETEKEEELQALRTCITRLSRSEQEIISLKFGAEMNNRQIARMLSLSESNVGIIVYRAVRKLRDSLREKGNA
jgi:RNA polymerase sigma-70 factor (TIGR02952 family)